MANKRMFAMSIVDSDAFLEMPLTTQALYFHLNMRADDDGFIGNPKKIMRIINASDDDMKILIAKRFILVFNDGVIVIKHWRMHNTIQKDRYTPTPYQDELNSLFIKSNKSYSLEPESNPKCFQNVSKVETKCIQNVSPDIDLDIDLNNVCVGAREDNEETNKDSFSDFANSQPKFVLPGVIPSNFNGYKDLKVQLFNAAMEHNKTAPKERKIPISGNLIMFEQKEMTLLVSSIGANEAPEDVYKAFKNFLKTSLSDTWQQSFTWKNFCNNYTNYKDEFFTLERYMKSEPETKDATKTVVNKFFFAHKDDPRFNADLFEMHVEDWKREGRPSGEAYFQLQTQWESKQC